MAHRGMTASSPIRVTRRRTFLDVSDEIDDLRVAIRKHRSKSCELPETPEDPLYVRYAEHLVRSAVNLKANRNRERNEFQEVRTSENVVTNVFASRPHCGGGHWNAPFVSYQSGVDKNNVEMTSEVNSIAARIPRAGFGGKRHVIERFTFVDIIEAEEDMPKENTRRSCSLPPTRTSSSFGDSSEISVYAECLQERAAQLRAHSEFEVELQHYSSLSENDGPLVEAPSTTLINDIEQGNLTTLMVCGLSSSFMDDGLGAFLDQFGCVLPIDYTNLPTSRQSRLSARFAFLNFMTPTAAKMFVQLFDAFPFEVPEGGERPRLQIARVQGSEAMREERRLQMENRRQRRHVKIRAGYA